MRTLVVSYSLTGNNDAFASRIAAACGGTHCSILDGTPRSMGTIALDMLFGRTPKVSIPPELDAEWDAFVFIAPVWMGMIASPLRGIFRRLFGRSVPYAFMSLSGGADGSDSNPKLADELKKRLGLAPSAVFDAHIADLLPREPKPTRKMTSGYRASGEDLAMLTEKAISILRDIGIPARR